MKFCRKCQTSKPLTAEYWAPSGQTKDGFQANCRTCQVEYVRQRRAGKITPFTPVMIYQGKWVAQRVCSTCRQTLAAHTDNFYGDRSKGLGLANVCRRCDAERKRSFEAANRETVRERHRLLQRRLRKTSPKHALKHRITWHLRHALRAKRSVRWAELVGYTADELKAHIERQFTKGMNWEAYLRGEIHIDHIIPLSSFKFEDERDPEFRAAWALTNLRPLWAAENIRKSDKRLHLL